MIDFVPGRFVPDKIPDLFVGVLSEVGPRKHMVFIDYDNLPYGLVVKRVKYLIKKFKLADFYILRSSHSHYWAVCFGLVSFSKYVDILRHSGCCKNFVVFTVKCRKSTLRVSRKKCPVKVVKIIRSEHGVSDVDSMNSFFNFLRFEGNLQ